MEYPVYIFRGSPASGKGTLVPEFCKILPHPVALLEQDVLRWRFHKIDRSYAEVEDTEHTFAFNNLLVLLEQYLRNDRYSIVIEGLFTWDDTHASQGNMKQIIALIKRYNKPYIPILLKADKEELVRRSSQRAHVVPSDEFDMLYNNIYKTIAPEEIIVDTTGQTVKQSVKHLLEQTRLATQA